MRGVHQAGSSAADLCELGSELANRIGGAAQQRLRQLAQQHVSCLGLELEADVHCGRTALPHQLHQGLIVRVSHERLDGRHRMPTEAAAGTRASASVCGGAELRIGAAVRCSTSAVCRRSHPGNAAVAGPWLLPV